MRPKRRPGECSGQFFVHAATARLECCRQTLAELAEQLVVRSKLLLPRRGIDPLELGVLCGGQLFQPTPIEVLEPGHFAERCLDAACTPPATLENPLQNAHVLAEPRPDELAVCVAPKPV